MRNHTAHRHSSIPFSHHHCHAHHHPDEQLTILLSSDFFNSASQSLSTSSSPKLAFVVFPVCVMYSVHPGGVKKLPDKIADFSAFRKKRLKS